MDGARQLVAREPQRPELARLYERRWVGAGEPVVRQIQMPQSGDLAVMGDRSGQLVVMERQID